MDNLITLILLILLQAVLGIDNLLYISIESKRAPENKQAKVRILGISIAIIFRILLLFILTRVIAYFQAPIGNINWQNYFAISPNIHSLIVLFGGVFIVYTAIKEIWHMLSNHNHIKKDKNRASIPKITATIVIMNIIFSFDSILSAIALTKVFWIMVVAIIISGIIMIWISGYVTAFLKKNRMYEVLGLFILFVVGIMLLTEGGYLAHIIIFNEKITPMSKTTFYFVIFILVIVDVIQSQYQKKLMNNNDSK